MIQALRNTITKGLFTLPCGYIIASILWLCSPNLSWQGFLLFAGLGIMSFGIYLHYIRISLFREYGNFFPVAFIIMYALMPYNQLQWNLLAIPLFVLCNAILFSAYDNRHPERYLFHVFLLLGISILFLPELLWMCVPFFLFALIFIRAITPKSLVSCVLGLLIVPLFYIIYCTLDSEAQWLHFSSINYSAFLQWTMPQTIYTGYVFFLLLCGIIHFHTTKFNDNIRSRMNLYILNIETILLAIGTCIIPEKAHILQILTILCGAPLLTHYFLLAKGFIVDVIFILSIVFIVLMPFVAHGIIH